MNFEPVNTVSVVDEVVKRITDAIIKRQLKPGDKIPNETELCAQLGVGRNSLREAMKMLSAMGILEIRRGDGTYIVEKVSPSVFDSLVYSLILEQSTQDEILELRKTLEIDILELVINKAADEEIERLDKLTKQFLEAIENNDLEEAAALDLKFHYELIDIAKNPLFGRIVKGFYELFWPSVYTTLKSKQEYRGAYAKHKGILEVIRKRDKQGIEAAIDKSLEVWKDYWQDHAK